MKRETMTGEQAAAFRAAIIEACAINDPARQSDMWPDPVGWDGRPLRVQATEIVSMATAWGMESESCIETLRRLLIETAPRRAEGGAL